ncbi:MAG: helix-turn-helix transcriptional regulator [Prevotellaceae bacterium]|nr:helix-turn-helix transcriptional regulator [Prevotellaceae bacterium]
MKERIRQLMESQHMNNTLFANATGINPATLTNIFKGRTNPTLNHVEAIKKRFPNINIDWLMFGQGPMFLEEPSAATSADAPQGDDQQGGSGAATASSSPSAAGGAMGTAAEAAVPSPAVAAVRQEEKLNRNLEKLLVKNIDKPQRRIAEIRIFYDDNTWETFVPKK